MVQSMRRASARIAGRARVSAMEARAEVPPGGRSVGDGEEEAPLPPKKEEMADVMVKEEVKEEVYGMGEVCELVKKEEVVVTIKTEEAGPAKRQESYGRVKKQEPEFELPGSQVRATKRTRDIKPKVELAPKKEEPLDSETDDHHNNGGYGEDDGDYLGMNDEEQEDEQPSCKRQKPSAEQASTKKAAAPKKTPKPKNPSRRSSALQSARLKS